MNSIEQIGEKSKICNYEIMILYHLWVILTEVIWITYRRGPNETYTNLDIIK